MLYIYSVAKPIIAAAGAHAATGIAEVTVNVGTESNRSIMLRAAAAGAESDAFTIWVGTNNRRLELLTPTRIDSVVDRSERLR